MSLLSSSTRNIVKVGFLAAAVVVATLGLAHEPNAESASDTQIIFSYSNIAPIPAESIILTPGGAPRPVYIWVTDVKEPAGVSTFQLALQYDATDFLATTVSGDLDGIGDGTWLGSTGRSSFCQPDGGPPEPGKLFGACYTLGPPPPVGPTGSGLLGNVLLWPGAELGAASQLVLVEPEACPPTCTGVLGTYLLDTNFTPENIKQIPLTLVESTVVFLGCADNSPPPSGDGVVDLPNDILGVLLRFDMTSSDPDWDPLFDLNGDGLIDLPNDVLGTILQFQLPCSHP